VVKALPKGVRPVVLADRGFRRASFPHWLERHGLRYVVRLKKGTCIIQGAGQGWKLGREGLSFGELRFRESVRYGLYHGRPHDVRISVVLCCRVSKSKARNARRRAPEESWYLATNLAIAKAAASWYWQRGWVEQSLKDSKSRFDLKRVRVSSAERLSRLLMALTISLCWLTLMALPEIAHRPEASDRR
jgi:hypothetical protein